MAAFGVFYSVSRLFHLSRRLRLSLVIIAAVLTTAHQLLVHWYFELPALIYYITAFFTNFFFYVLPLGLGVGIYLVIKVLFRNNDDPSTFHVKQGDTAHDSAGLNTGLSAHSLLDATLNTIDIRARQHELKQHPMPPRAACAFICDDEQPTVSATIEPAGGGSAGAAFRNTVTLATDGTATDTVAATGTPFQGAGSSSCRNGVTVERSMWLTGEEMIIKSSDEGTEVSFNTETPELPRVVPYQTGAAAMKNAQESDNVHIDKHRPDRHVSADIPATAAAAVNTVFSAHKMAAQNLTGSSLLDGNLSLNQKQRELLAQIRTTIDSIRNKKRSYLRLFGKARTRPISAPSAHRITTADTAAANPAAASAPANVSVTADSTAVGTDMTGPFAQNHSRLDRPVVRMDKEGKMAVIEAEDKSDNSHVLIITSNVPESVGLNAQYGSEAKAVHTADAATGTTVPSVSVAAAITGADKTAPGYAGSGADTVHWHKLARFWKKKRSVWLVLGLLKASVAVAVCVSVYSTFLALALPEVNEVNVSLDVPVEFDGLDLMQLSDFQDSPVRRKDRATYIFNKVAQMRPALVVITGDFKLQHLDEPDIQPLMRMNVPYGVYAVGASSSERLQYEYYRLFDDWDYSFLSNSVKSVSIGKEQLNIIGISEQDAQDGNVSVLHTRKIQDRNNSFNLLLSNCSRYAESLSAISKDNIDLMLVGKLHEHAEPLLTDYIINLNLGFVSGLFRPDENSHLLMYVSSGSQVPDATPSRLGTRNEITHITIHSTRAPVPAGRNVTEEHTPVKPLPDNIPVNDRITDNTSTLPPDHFF